MSQSTAIPVNITLDGHNYREWAFCVEIALLLRSWFTLSFN
jgi:hypothetical protein